MSNRLYAYLLLLFSFGGCFRLSAQDTIEISGEILNTSLTNRKAATIHLTNEFDLLDSVTFSDNTFQLKGILTKAPEVIYLVVKDSKGQIIDQWSSYLIGGKLHFSGSNFETATLSGNQRVLEVIKQMKEYNALLAPVGDTINAIYQRIYGNLTESDGHDSSAMKAREKKYESDMLNAYQQRFKISRDYIKKHPNHYSSFVALQESIQIYLIAAYEKSAPGGMPELQNLLAQMSPAIRVQFAQSVILHKLNGHTTSVPGQKIIPISEMGLDGNVVSTETLKGKVFLIDFWGSWCGACRNSHPHLKDLYSKYKSKGFEILSVAEEYGAGEKQQAKWRKAVAEDGLPWLNILNKTGKVDYVTRFGIYAFPTKFLIDREGTILLRMGVDNEGQLDQKLRELFDEEVLNTHGKTALAQNIALTGKIKEAADVAADLDGLEKYLTFHYISDMALQHKDTNTIAIELIQKTLGFIDTGRSLGMRCLLSNWRRGRCTRSAAVRAGRTG